MISISGVRGIVGEGLTPEVALSFAQAFGHYCNSGKVVLGRDSRVSGPMLSGAVSAGLLAVGCDVIDIGIAPTPTTQLATEKLRAAGGLMLTASHNPVMWNGLKMLAPDGLFLDAEQGARVLEIRYKKTYAFKAWDKLGGFSSYGKAVDDHLEAIKKLSFIDTEKIRRRKFRVVADCVNGAGGVIVPQLLEHFGCDAVMINGATHGRFAHSPEPLPENLVELGKTVREHRADFGFAVDPDSDRLALVSEQGTPLGEEYTLAIAVNLLLKKRRGKVAVNVSTTMAIDDIAAKHGCSVERTRVGEINVAKRMREIGAVIGGEGNGGVMLPDVHLGRDAMVGIAMTLQQLAEFGGPMSALHASLPQYVMCKRKVELREGIDAQKVLDKLEKKYQRERLDKLDGIKILRDHAWVQVRASNTEPIIRIMSEARTLKEAEALCDEAASVMT
jgi:phosphomannomutase